MTQTKAQLIDGKSAEIEFSGGSAGAPAISFTGDTNTGIYSPGADQLALSTNGTGRLFIDSSGRVGIGRSNPQSGIDVRPGAPGDLNAITMGYGRAANPTDAIHKIRWTSDDLLIEADSANTIVSNIRFYNDGTEKMVLDSSGRLGIGTSSVSNTLDIRATGANVGVRSTTSGQNQYIFFSNTADSTNGLILQTGSELRLQQSDNVSGSRITFYTKDSERVRIDDQGRLGIGTTSPSNILHIAEQNPIIRLQANSGSYQGRNSIGQFDNIFYIEVDNDNVIANSALSFYIDATERARIDSSGRLLVGTSSSPSSGNGQYAKLAVQGSTFSSTGAALFNLQSGKAAASHGPTDDLGFLQFTDNAGNEFAWIRGVVNGTPGVNDYPGALVFSVTQDGSASPTERQRINSAGATLFFSSADGIRSAVSASAGTSTAVFWGRHSATSTSNGTDSFFVWSNGNVVNTNNSYGAISDIKLKENIVDAGSQWNDLKALQVRKYNFKEGQTHTQIGLVAQEVELISPGLVSESPDRDAEGNDLGTTTKSVNYSVLYMKAVKALQEAMERIETLEAKVAALESA